MPKAAAFLIIFLLQISPLYAQSGAEAPEELAAWRNWVLHGFEERYFCPADESGRPLCFWPVTLNLDLNSSGGSWQMIFERKTEGATLLPGGPGAWPREARLADGQHQPILGRQQPAVWLPAGRHHLSGIFSWENLPETIDLPLGFVLDIKIDGRSLDFPAIEVDYGRSQARLWLRNTKRPSEPVETNASEVDRLSVGVNRFIRDSQPMMIQSRLKLVVSGRAREVLLDNVLLPGTQATYMSSPLPAQLTAEGLRVKVKPGIYEIFVDSRSLNRSESAGPVPAGSAEPEFWAFEAQPQLRQVVIEGAEQIDPSQADLYGPWRSYPVYLMEPGRSLTFTTISRGDPEPPPNRLNLARECWLDYDGGGLSCRDRLSGTLSRQWHLNTSAPFTLAQASLGGQPQVITWQIDSKGQRAPGLQLREGRINLAADLRIENFDGRLPASGWDQKLETEGQKFNLPPGYRLFHVSGADAQDGSSRYGGAGTWTGAWGTLDFFVVLIISIAVWKLYGRNWGLLALVALIFCYHEPLAPRMVFLHILAAVALLRILPAENKKIRFLVRFWRFLAGLTLIILTSLFLINQVKISLFPQLENPRQSYNYSIWGQSFGPGADSRAEPDYYARNDVALDLDMAEEMVEQPPSPAMASLAQEKGSMAEAPLDRRQKSLASGRVAAKPAPQAFSNFSNQMVQLRQAPDAKVQNSAPRPDWNWRSARLYYNGSVTADQEVKLYLISPTPGRIMGLARIILISLLALLMLNPRRLPPPAHAPKASQRPLKTASALVGLAILFAAVFSPTPALAQGLFPTDKMLEEYRSRLLEKDDRPAPGIPQMIIQAGPERLTLELAIEADGEQILVLPNFDREIFRPDLLRMIGGEELPLLDDNGRWLVLVPEGRHQLVLSGRLRRSAGAAGAFQISFPDGTRPQHTVIEESPVWKVEGLEPDGQMSGGALYFTAEGLDAPVGQTEEESGDDFPESLALEPFFLVQRTISLGLEWKIHNSIRRITPTGSPVTLRLPLIKGENPVSGGFQRDGQHLTLNFGPQVEELSWESRLDMNEELNLKAQEGPWSESWCLDVSPIWRVKPQGLTPVHYTSNGFWQPQWRPWPGETLTLTIDRPEPVPGKYLVIDQGRLSLMPGENSQEARLNFRVRSSQGGPYSFQLPAGIEIKEYRVNGRPVPLVLGEADNQGLTLTAPLASGNNDLEVAWVAEQPLGMVSRTPALNLDLPSANLTISMTLPENRWIIWTWGPLQGPAVQFWPLVAVILLAALILKRYSSAPLSLGAWFLLGLGLMQLNIFGAMIVAGWILIIERRLKRPYPGALGFNLGQIALTLWTLLALFLIYEGIKYGLLQNPDMKISGGGSYGQKLVWFVDRSDGPWPVASTLTVSVWIYKALMLAWSLWLAVSLVGWLKWAWRAFSRDSIWKKRPPRLKKKEAPEPGPAEVRTEDHQ